MGYFSFVFIFVVVYSASGIQAKQGGNGASCSPILSIEGFGIPIKVGNDIIIKCRACGKNDIFWVKDGKRFGETNRVTWISARKVSSNPLVVEGKLKIDKLRKRDRGVYTCYAVDFFANIMEKGDIRLIVKGHHHKSEEI